MTPVGSTRNLLRETLFRIFIKVRIVITVRINLALNCKYKLEPFHYRIEFQSWWIFEKKKDSIPYGFPCLNNDQYLAKRFDKYCCAST